MKRRAFILKSALATTCVGSSTLAFANILNAKNPNEKLNIGVIGLGVRGGELIRSVNQIDAVNVIACCDIIPARLENELSKAEVAIEGHHDYRKLLENNDVDAVLIATPTNSHSKIAIDALDAGKHVYCESTMVKGFDGALHLVNKAKASNKIVQVGHQYRSSPLYVHVVDLIKNGELGKISSFDCHWNKKEDWRQTLLNPELERLINWRMYREFSGGLVTEDCSHQIDFVNWVLEEIPEKVRGTGKTNSLNDGRETFDTIQLDYDYPKGIKAKFTATLNEAKESYQIKIIGDRGTIVLDKKNAWLYQTSTSNNEKGKQIFISVAHADPTIKSLIDFKESIINNQEPVSNVISGAKTAVCVQMGLDAMYTNEMVSWKEGMDF